MSRKARIRAAAVAAVALAIGLLFATGVVPGVFATFSAETENPVSQFAGGWVSAATPSAPGTVAGLGAALSWTVGATGVTGQQLWYSDATPTTSNCTGASYTHGPLGSLTAAQTSVTAANAAVPSGDDGDYICYQILSTNGPWSTPGNFSAVQVGLVPTSWSYSGSGTHTIGNGTTITVNFNQAISFSTGNTDVCVFSGTVLLGDSSGACTGSGDTAVFGKLVGGTANRHPACTSSSFTGSGTSSLTVTVGGCPTNGNPNGRGPATMGGSASYNASGSTLTSSTGGLSQCTLSTCTPSTNY